MEDNSNVIGPMEEQSEEGLTEQVETEDILKLIIEALEVIVEYREHFGDSILVLGLKDHFEDFEEVSMVELLGDGLQSIFCQELHIFGQYFQEFLQRLRVIQVGFLYDNWDDDINQVMIGEQGGAGLDHAGLVLSDGFVLHLNDEGLDEFVVTWDEGVADEFETLAQLDHLLGEVLDKDKEALSAFTDTLKPQVASEAVQ